MSKIPERPVFEWDEAVSIQELKTVWLKQMQGSQRHLTMHGAMGLAQASVLCQQLLEDIIDWTKEGKPSLEEWAKKKWGSEHDQD